MIEQQVNVPEYQQLFQRPKEKKFPECSTYGKNNTQNRKLLDKLVKMMNR